jgi:hypothetical protein
MKPIRKQKVFISYAREDQTSALVIKEFLEKNGVSTWFDIEDVVPGAVWREHARAAIEEADYFIALLSETSVSKREGYVWEEFDLALIKQREFSDNRVFIFPVNIDSTTIPDEFASYNCLPFSDSTLKKILRYIERRRSPRKIIAWILFACLIPFAIIPFLNWQDKKEEPAPARLRLICKVTIWGLESQEHLQGVYAFILGPNNDTIIKSPPSGSNGQIYFELDTTHEVPATVWYYHPLYETISKSYRLTEHATYRQVELELRKDTTATSTAPVKSKFFMFTGLALTEAEKKKIKDNTGYSFSYSNPAVKIVIDYDHDRLVNSAVKGKFVFEGSKVYLIHNSIKTDTGIFLPPDGTLARSKADIEKDNEAPFQELLATRRDEIVNTLITCLKEYQ